MRGRSRPWARVRAEQTTADLLIFGPIGASWWDAQTITAAAVVGQLAVLPPSVRTIRVRISSEGGDPFDAVAIHSELRRQASEHGRAIETRIEGLAASAASIIACAGDTRLIAGAGLLMIHDPWMLTIGDVAEHQRSIATLDAVTTAIVQAYRRVSSDAEEAIRAAMADETWYGASEAVAHGYATGVIDDVAADDEAVAAALEPRLVSRFRRVPSAVAARLPARPEPPLDPAVVVSLVAAASLDVAFAQALIDEAAPRDVVESRIASARQARETAETRAQRIRTLCGAHESTRSMADEFIASGADVASVGRILARTLALLDTVEIDTSLPVDGQRGGRGAIDITAIYGARNAQRTH